MKRLLTFALITLTVWALETWWLSSRQPDISNGLALRQFDSANPDAGALRRFEAGKDLVPMLAAAINLLSAWLCFGRCAKGFNGQMRELVEVSEQGRLAIGIITGENTGNLLQMLWLHGAAIFTP